MKQHNTPTMLYERNEHLIRLSKCLASIVNLVFSVITLFMASEAIKSISMLSHKTDRYYIMPMLPTF